MGIISSKIAAAVAEGYTPPTPFAKSTSGINARYDDIERQAAASRAALIARIAASEPDARTLRGTWIPCAAGISHESYRFAREILRSQTGKRFRAPPITQQFSTRERAVAAAERLIASAKAWRPPAL